MHQIALVLIAAGIYLISLCFLYTSNLAAWVLFKAIPFGIGVFCITSAFWIWFGHPPTL